MPRPPKSRTVSQTPSVTYFKPRGVPTRLLETVSLGLDELEALRLADLEGLYQEQAAQQMEISRPTFGRLVEQARRKVADALFHGKALALEGGAVTLRPGPWFGCGRCGRHWCAPEGSTAAHRCVGCGSEEVQQTAGPGAEAAAPVDAPPDAAGPGPGAPGRGCGRGRGGCGRGGGRRWRGGV